MTRIVLTAALSYLLGSIPFGYILVRTFRGEDVRQTGSGNIGATNVARSSTFLGIATLVLDALKGAAAVWTTEMLSLGRLGHRVHVLVTPQDPRFLQAQAVAQHAYLIASIAALFVILGHMFPVWLTFKGGKGVATGLGAFAVLAPKSILVAVVVFLLTVVAFRRVSLASIVAVGLFPIVAWSFNEYHNASLTLAVMATASALIIAKHHSNIARLVSGTEPLFHLRRG
ncbi:MAG: acyl-phosphate glycerol-3-phosphate acyltransferase [Acidobacteriaceae bacterium]|nr:acyl-phosphate glycerol-3-phosphate acyltransferase [Acidobacteriaceae bacterium]